jgi:xanthine phosphoribosyltransferase
MAEVARGIAAIAEPLKPDVIVTAEASGIPPAMATSLELGLPMIYAKKYVTPGPRHSFSRDVASATKGSGYSIDIRQRVIDPGQRALVVDDFLVQGRTAVALGEIIEEARCEMLGAAFAV